MGRSSSDSARADRRERLLDQIYDASFDPGSWVPVMEQLAREMAAETACMTTLDVFTGHGGGYTALVPDDTMNAYVSRWANDNPLHQIADPLSYIARWQPTTLRYEDWMERDALHRSAYFNEFLRPIGSENGIMMGLALVGTATTTMTVARSAHRGPFEDREIAEARSWQAHLMRAIQMARKMSISQASLDAIDQLVNSAQQCLFFLGTGGRIKRMSTPAEAMLAAGSELKAVNGVLTATRWDAERELRDLVGQSQGRDGAATRGGTMLLRGSEGSSYEVMVAPLGPRSTAMWASEPITLVTVTTRQRPPLPTDLALYRRFRLTSAEARLALALVKGDTLREVADGAGLSINTVRAQLSAIFSKTDCRRQSDLVRMLLSPDGVTVGG